MKKLHIVLKYPDSARLWRVWADSENEIDFRHDPETGARCTAAYAASELKYFLGKAMPGLEIGVGETPPAKIHRHGTSDEAQTDYGYFTHKTSLIFSRALFSTGTVAQSETRI